ncbi:hypothetical protein N0V82_001512 [Gnomoniopsis sp. IMI 355080]|nr:hypothetical protein N0V82_001512 [Gnomoniopsis sp. IMI 355080]
MSTQNTQDWKVKAEQKYKQSQDLIPEAWKLSPEVTQDLVRPLETANNNLIELDIPRRSGILNAHELRITEEYDVEALLKALASGELSALEVTVAFCKRAAIAQQLTSCLTEILFEQAQDRARQLDLLREKGQIGGPLHGLPISLKDSFQVQGTEATLGFVAYLDNGPSRENSCLVDVLLKQGAVLYCKTNTPQTLMTADSHNNVFGRTLNPWNTRLTAGGSSGGEGALVAFRGSPIGVGTDVAGSIRIPSLCCGLYGFKPTANRVPYGQQAPLGNPGLRTVQASAGPLTNDFDAMAIFMKAVLAARPAQLDSTAIDVPWMPVEGPKGKLRFGVLAEDPIFPLHPPVKNTLANAANLLEKAGHEIVVLRATDGLVAASYDVATQMWSLDRTSVGTVLKAGEPFIPSIVTGRNAIRQIKFDRSFVQDTRSIEDPLERLALLNVKRSEIQETWRELWGRHQLDAVIAPGSQTTAVEHDQYGPAPYTSIVNFLDVGDARQILPHHLPCVQIS